MDDYQIILCVTVQQLVRARNKGSAEMIAFVLTSIASSNAKISLIEIDASLARKALSTVAQHVGVRGLA